MVKILGVCFYWGETKNMKISFPAIGRTWETSLYGVSIGNAFFGIMLRGERA
jgi:hypothetical protein